MGGGGNVAPAPLLCAVLSHSGGRVGYGDPRAVSARLRAIPGVIVAIWPPVWYPTPAPGDTIEVIVT